MIFQISLTYIFNRAEWSNLCTKSIDFYMYENEMSKISKPYIWDEENAIKSNGFWPANQSRGGNAHTGRRLEIARVLHGLGKQIRASLIDWWRILQNLSLIEIRSWGNADCGDFFANFIGRQCLVYTTPHTTRWGSGCLLSSTLV